MSAGGQATPDAALRRLFMTLFLRGRRGRNLDPNKAPTSVGGRLALILVLYGLFGCFGLVFARQPVFGFSVYLHAMTFAFVGLFVASSSGEILFNREEADILLHRPVSPRALLWAKMRVLAEVALWMAGAFNLGGLLGGLFLAPRGLRFALGHALSTTLQALFTVGAVVLLYQLCLKFLGRERLEGLMTTAQVMMGIGAALAGQLPGLLSRGRMALPASLDARTWWMGLFPPAWFAGLDDVIHGGASAASWVLALAALGATALTLWLAFGRLAGAYGLGLQLLNENAPGPRPTRSGRPWHQRLAGLPLLRWWLRDPVVRASFQLSAAYMFRDRDTKLRLYPSMVPMLVLPLVLLLQEAGKGRTQGFGLALLVAFLGMLPLTGTSTLQHSAHCQAADLFRAAPLEGPGRLFEGLRRAVIFFLVAPMFLLAALIVVAVPAFRTHWPLLLPGLLLMPAFSRIPGVNGWEAPLSVAVEEAKNAGRIAWSLLAMVGAMAVAGFALLARHVQVFGGFLAVEALVMGGLCVLLGRRMARARW